jgi:hypothetical protein
MTGKNIRLPKEGLVEPEQDQKALDDVEGHGMPVTAPPSLSTRTPGHGGENIPSPTEDEDDVEGHGLPLTAPPSLSTRTPGHGGE